MKTSDRLNQAENRAAKLIHQYKHEYLTPEHVLHAICDDVVFRVILDAYKLDAYKSMQESLEAYFETLESVDKPNDDSDDESIELSHLAQQLFNSAIMAARSSGCEVFDIPHVVNAMLQLGEDCFATSLLLDNIDDQAGFIYNLAYYYGSARQGSEVIDADSPENNNAANGNDGDDGQAPWAKFVTCVTEQLRYDPEWYPPLIGREAELERTIQVLCRCDKNNPLHVGEPGVGKTALIYGLARRINEGRVPKLLKESKIYILDLGSMLADTQYRGDFEKRIKMVMEGVSRSSRCIVYIDEIHNIIGAGRLGDGGLDAANMLKPYLESHTIRFIGSTTYGEFNRYFAKSPGVLRRFQKIDIAEPSVDDTVQILEGLRERYELFHYVTYEPGVFEHAVRMADRYINERFLPDKAIDLIDEAGAQLVASRDDTAADQDSGRPKVDKALIDEVLARMTGVTSFADTDDDTAALAELEPRIKSRIYGQDEAVRQVVEAVQMSRAGLLDDNKPVASFLFVGPTGVGKTEVARVLAQELNLELIRFDMSEYAEKHTVAKLIGSPAGYVGYEDGGLLTDAVRKTPHCVLLFDEIEKAHPDVFNIFLQMMDYARLTDNRGQKADFRHAVIIMTSNAGAQFATQASVGFGSTVSAGQAMLGTVRKTFKPEFIARLSATIVFRDMDSVMAGMILDRKLAELAERLATKGVAMHLSPAARQQLLAEGFTRQAGAREIDRVIAQRLKPLFTRAILFGPLKEGGETTVDIDTDKAFTLR